MDSSTYRHLLGQLNKSCPISHHNFPSHNLLSLEILLEVSKDLNSPTCGNSSDFLGSFPCYQPFPYAIGKNTVLYCGSRLIDDATELVKRKMNWERKLKRVRVSNVDLAIKSVKKMRQNKVVKLSEGLKKFIIHFHSDPEPMFSGCYNWLYTGGSLCYIDEFDGVNIISPDFATTRPGFNIIKLDKTLSEVQYKSFTELKTYSPVFQITCRDKQENLIFCVRQKNHINVFKTTKTDSLFQPAKLWRKKVLGTKLLTCADVKANCEEVLVADSSLDSHIFNIEKKVKIWGQPGKKVAQNLDRDCWSQVAFGELGIYWAFRNHFTIFDERAVYSGLKLEFDPATATNNCESICSFLRSPGDSNYIYLGTTHNILQMDLRKGEAVQRWTHLMKNPPQYMTSLKDRGDNNEILFLQSQNVDETVAIVNNLRSSGESVSFISRSLPCLLKSIKESLNLARFHGVCLSPFVAKKIVFAVTGIQCLKNSQNHILLLKNNSGGDIFSGTLTGKSAEGFLSKKDEEEIVCSMKMYECHCEKFAPRNPINRQFELSNMSHLLKCLDQPTAKRRKRKKSEIYWKYHEMYSPESLVFFKDFLAQKILKVWGHYPGPLGAGDSPVSVDEKVREWMDKC